MVKIIINADDYGLNRTCTDAIAKAFKQGLISDTTIMANGEAFEYAVEKAKEEGFFDKIGIHLNLTEGVPLTENIKKYPTFVSDGLFHGKINRVKLLSKPEKRAIYEELSAQAKKICDSGLVVTHADSHHHIHTAIFVAPVFARVCREFGFGKVRLHRNIGAIQIYKKPVKWFYNKWLKAHGFQTTRYFGSMEDVGLVGSKDGLEIMVHPDFDRNGNLIDRTDFENGYPVGEQLKDLAANNEDILMIDYGDL